MPRFWISWYEPLDDTEDYRPRKWPLAPAIVAYWCTGHSVSLRKTKNGNEDAFYDSASLCAIIDAENEPAAKQAVEDQGWSPATWRFCDQVSTTHWPEPTRFPVPNYATARRQADKMAELASTTPTKEKP